MKPELVLVPYHLGRTGVGPANGVPVLAEALADLAETTVTVTRELEDTYEVAACFDVVRGVAARVAEVVARGDFPLVLAGNCHSSLGTCAGLGRSVGVVWLDAHADFNTPDSTPSGFIHGMGLALLTGSGWEALRSTVPEHRPIPEEHVVLAARDLDPAEEERLNASPILRAEFEDLPDALDVLRERVDDVYLHVDLDVLDPTVGRANSLACEGGATLEQAAGAIEAVCTRFTVRAAALTWYDPPYDPDGAIPPAARVLVERLFSAMAVAR
jgi:arginase